MDWRCGVCVRYVCIYPCTDVCVCLCVLKESLPYFRPVVFSVDIAHSSGLNASQCGQTHKQTMQTSRKYTPGRLNLCLGSVEAHRGTVKKHVGIHTDITSHTQYYIYFMSH